jgi:tetratricopeptide (TPR) repeat protein
MRAYVTEYPDDPEGWYTYGEALYHLRESVPKSPDTIIAAFDKVIAGDSSLTPAVVHPLELMLMYRDTARFDRYLRLFERTAPAQQAAAARVAARIAWGPQPSDSALRSALSSSPHLVFLAAGSLYRDETATSDTILARMERVRNALPVNSPARRFSPISRAFALVGFGRLGEARAMVDTVAAIAPGAAVGILGWPIVLGLVPSSSGGRQLDSLLALDRDDSESPRLSAYRNALGAIVRGQPDSALRMVNAGMELRAENADSARESGLLEATGGWAHLAKGDTTAGIAALRSGLAKASGPNTAEATSFLRFQLALALAADAGTRDEGITRLRYGFDHSALYLVPLSALALGRAYEAAGQADSAAIAYGRFLRLWDKADPEVRGRVTEARDALQRFTAEPR